MKILGRTQVVLFFVSVMIAFGLSACGGDQSGSSNAASVLKATANSADASSSQSASSQQVAAQGSIALPPMGWASWNAYGCNITEDLVKTAANTISDGLKKDGALMKAGYSYINVDDCWFAPSRDPQGNLVADPVRFPSGIKALADYVHARGLKFGIYEVPSFETCAQRNNLYPGHTTPMGSLGHEVQDANTFASWGVDYVKYDWCTPDGTLDDQVAGFQKMRDALASAGAAVNRRIVYSINPNSFHVDKTGRSYDWGQIADLWRSTEDITYNTGTPGHQSTPDFSRIVNQNFYGNLFPEAQHTGAYNDADMMLAGFGLTAAQDQTHMSLWAISGAPLILGLDLTVPVSAATMATLTNPEVLAVDQDVRGLQAIRVAVPQNGLGVWAKLLSGKGRRAVVLLNTTGTAASITVNWKDLGLDPAAAADVRDIWAHTDLGSHTSGYTVANVPAGGSVMLTIVGTDDASKIQTAKPMSHEDGVARYTLNASTGGYIDINYRNAGTSALKVPLILNESVLTTIVLPVTPKNAQGTVTLYMPFIPGSNQLTFVLPGKGRSAPAIDKVTVLAAPQPALPPVVYEAESSANIIQDASIAACNICSGGNKVGNLTNADSSLQFNGVMASSDGQYAVPVVYISADDGGGAPRALNVSVNGGPLVPVQFPGEGTWDFPILSDVQVVVPLKAGVNTIKFSVISGNYGPDIDGLGQAVKQ
ncbi:alpha-galactosidase D [Paraburkholderia sp.]|uniref:alpha-galactosidase D n=1 Tax=Paraburkholderia sp. TaxID=1926495 RepID=UPI003D6EBB80